MFKMILFICIACLTFIDEADAYTESVAMELPESFSQTQFNLATSGLGYSCLTMTSIKDTLPCNPALISLERDNQFTAQVSFGNDYKALQKIDRLVNGQADKQFAQSLFSENHVIEMEANGEMTFQTNHFGARFAPYRVTYMSVVRDAAYPVIFLHAKQERSFTFQAGSRIYDNLYGGLQTRIVERKFLQKQFALFEVLSEDGNKILTPSTQRALYLEPGLTYFFNAPWKPRISMVAANTGFVDQNYDELNANPHAEGGIGIAPPVGWGKLELGLDYRELGSAANFTDNLHFGSSYTFGALQGLFGIDTSTLSGGVLYGVAPLKVGIVYSTTKTIGQTAAAEYAQTVYTQFAFNM